MLDWCPYCRLFWATMWPTNTLSRKRDAEAPRLLLFPRGARFRKFQTRHPDTIAIIFSFYSTSLHLQQSVPCFAFSGKWFCNLIPRNHRAGFWYGLAGMGGEETRRELRLEVWVIIHVGKRRRWEGGQRNTQEKWGKYGDWGRRAESHAVTMHRYFHLFPPFAVWRRTKTCIGIAQQRAHEFFVCSYLLELSDSFSFGVLFFFFVSFEAHDFVGAWTFFFVRGVVG